MTSKALWYHSHVFADSAAAVLDLLRQPATHTGMLPPTCSFSFMSYRTNP